MLKKFFLPLLCIFLFGTIVSAQNNKSIIINRPKVVVGLMVDQMRWDYLYRYVDRLGEGGFKRLIREGFSCENTLIKQAPTVTALGHSSVYTGSIPAIHGIAGNDWYDREWGRKISNVEDSTSVAVGTTAYYSKSPNNLLVTTIGDELRMATNFKSKVISISIKDRAAILPGGHLANAAFWEQGDKFVTSSYYMAKLPEWVTEFNKTDWRQKLMPDGWDTLYPINTYTESDPDDMDYENPFSGEKKAVFPHTKAGLTSSPFGNTFIFEFAKKAIAEYELGKDEFTDMLTVSLSSPDAIGHRFGPTSVEVEDNYLRLDKDLEAFFKFLDEHFGREGYLFFITADHGASQSPGFLEKHKLPTGILDSKFVENLNNALFNKFHVANIILDQANSQLYLDYSAMKKNALSRDDITSFIATELKKNKGIQYVFDNEKLSTASIPERLKMMFINGYNSKRSGDILVVKSAGWKIGSKTGATHSDWNPYDAHIPLVWMGKGISHGKTNRTIWMTDIAPTLAAILRIQMPSGNIGDVITEITNQE